MRIRTAQHRSLHSGATTALLIICGLGGAIATEPQSSQTSRPPEAVSSGVPRFKVDPFWPAPLPNNWILGQVSGVAVDDQDHIWVVHRPRTLDARQRGEEGLCCEPAPPVIEFAQDGTVLRSWGGPGEGFEWPDSEHGVYVDHENHVWIGGNASTDSHILKFTADGEFLLQIGRAGQSGGSNDTQDLGRRRELQLTRKRTRFMSPMVTVIVASLFLTPKPGSTNATGEHTGVPLVMLS